MNSARQNKARLRNLKRKWISKVRRESDACTVSVPGRGRTGAHRILKKISQINSVFTAEKPILLQCVLGLRHLPNVEMG